jgi:hypothetical protein
MYNDRWHPPKTVHQIALVYPRSRVYQHLQASLAHHYANMFYITTPENHWAAGLYTLSGILRSCKHNVSETGSVSTPSSNGPPSNSTLAQTMEDESQ